MSEILGSQTIGTSRNLKDLTWNGTLAPSSASQSIGRPSTTVQEEATYSQPPIVPNRVEGSYSTTQQTGLLPLNEDRTQMTSFSSVDFMFPLQTPDHTVSEFDSIGPEASFGWTHIDLFNDIQNVLSGHSAY